MASGAYDRAREDRVDRLQLCPGSVDTERGRPAATVARLLGCTAAAGAKVLKRLQEHGVADVVRLVPVAKAHGVAVREARSRCARSRRRGRRRRAWSRPRVIAAANEAAGRTVVRALRVLAPGAVPAPAPAAAPAESAPAAPTGEAKTRDTAREGYRRAPGRVTARYSYGGSTSILRFKR